MSRRRARTTTAVPKVVVPPAGRERPVSPPPEGAPSPMESAPAPWVSRAMEGVWLALAAATPALVNPAALRYFEAQKVAFLRSAAVVLIALWLTERLEARHRAQEGHQALGTRLQGTGARGRGAEGGGRGDAGRGPALWPVHGGRGEAQGTKPRAQEREPRTHHSSLITHHSGPPFALPVAVLMAAYLGAALLSELPSASLLGSYERSFGAATYLACGVIFFAVATHLRTAGQLRRLLLAISLGTVLPSLVGLLQFWHPIELGWITGILESGQRIVGTLGQPTYLGGYLAMALPATLYLLWRAPSPRGRALLGVLALLQVATLILSETRAAWAGAAVGAAILAATLRSGRGQRWLPRSRWVLAGLAVAMVALATVNVPGTALNEAAARTPYLGRLARLAEFEAGSGRVRSLIWAQVPGLLAERPILGHGPEMMRYSFERRYPPELLEFQSGAAADRAHNWLLEALVSTGLVGAAAQLLLLGTVVAVYRRAGRRVGESRGRTKPEALDPYRVALAGIGAGLVDQLAGVPSSGPTLLFWLYLGMASANAASIALRCPTFPGARVSRPRLAGGTPALPAAKRGGTADATVGASAPSKEAAAQQGLGAGGRAPHPDPLPRGEGEAKIKGEGEAPKGEGEPHGGWGRVAGMAVLAAASAVAVAWIGVAPVVADVVAARAVPHAAAGRWREAFEGYQAAASIQPEAEYFFLMGRMALRAAEERRQEEISTWLRLGNEALHRAERANPLRLDVAMAQGRLHQIASGLPGSDRGEGERSAAAYGRAVLLAPSRVAARDSYAVALMDLGRHDEARAQLDASLRLDPAHAPTYGHLGRYYYDLRRMEEALDALRRGVELDPSSAALRGTLAGVYARKGEVAEAEEQYEQALRLAPRNANLYLELSNLYRSAGDSGRAREVLARGLEAVPGHAGLAEALRRAP